jgi:hypothetical protein
MVQSALLLPHAMTAIEHSKGLEFALELNSRLLNKVGFYLDGRAEFNEAEYVFSLALAIQEANYGPDSNNPDVAKSLKGLGNILVPLQAMLAHFSQGAQEALVLLFSSK